MPRYTLYIPMAQQAEKPELQLKEKFSLVFLFTRHNVRSHRRAPMIHCEAQRSRARSSGLRC